MLPKSPTLVNEFELCIYSALIVAVRRLPAVVAPRRLPAVERLSPERGARSHVLITVAVMSVG